MVTPPPPPPPLKNIWKFFVKLVLLRKQSLNFPVFFSTNAHLEHLFWTFASKRAIKTFIVLRLSFNQNFLKTFIFFPFLRFWGNFFPGPKFCFLHPKNGLLDPQNLGKESKQHRNQAKFELFWFQRFLQVFGGADPLPTLQINEPETLYPPSKVMNQFHRSWNRL